MMKPKANTANTAKMAKRLLSYIISRYKATFAAVLFSFPGFMSFS